MNGIETGKENLKTALLEVGQNYLKNLELAPEEDISFSPELEKNMARLLRSQRKPYRKLLDFPCKKVIAACLTGFILTGVLVSCTIIREPMVAFFTNVYEKFTEFFFSDDAQDAASKVIEEIRMPTYVPEGYELVEEPILMGENDGIRIVWKNQKETKIIFSQLLLGSKTTIDTENSEIKVIDIETTISVMEKNNRTFVFWNDNTYAYTLITSDISEDDIVKIVKSVK